MVVGSSPTRRSGSILNVAPCSSPTPSSLLGMASGAPLGPELLDRGKRYPDTLTCRLAVAMGREGRAWRPRAALERRDRRAMVIVFIFSFFFFLLLFLCFALGFGFCCASG